MAYTPQTKKVKTAITDHSQLPIQAIHQTTTDIFQWRVSRIIEMAPTQHLKFNYGSKTILMPMPAPTIGVLTQYNRWFWVPFRTINPRWNDFTANNMHVDADGTTHTPQTVPEVGIDQMIDAIISAATTSGATGSHYDFVIQNSGQNTYYLHTRTSKNMLTILRQLGYKFSMHKKGEYVSAQPLLAAARIFCDWYFNENYKMTSRYNDVIKLLKYDSGTTPITPSLTSSRIGSILRLIMYCYYESSWDIDAWDNPNAPNILTTLANNNTRIDDQDGLDSYVRTNNGDTFMASDISNGSSTLITSDFSQYTINTLKQLQAYIKRNQLSGNDTAKRYLAQWGLQLESELQNRSKKISEQKLETQIWKVESNTDSAEQGGTNLGAFAGNGEINGKEGNLDFTANEAGYLIEITTITPRTFTDMGAEAHIYHMTRFDFYQPDFDGIGVTPILKQMIFSTQNGANNAANISNTQIFGFLPRYWEYKIIRDHISGDYEYPTKKATYDPYTLHRELNYNDPSDIIHDEEYTRGSDWQQYNRLFYAYENDKTPAPDDRFNQIHWLEGELSGKFKGLYDDYNFDENHHNETVNV